MATLIGLTGGIASGKSTVAGLLRARGFPVIDADEVAREVVAPGSPALAAIRAEFGDAVIDADGGLDRAAMAARVFADAGARRRLEAITHPAIARLGGERMAAAVRGGAPVVFYEAALLVETGRHKDFDALWVVTAPEQARAARAVARGGLDGPQARARIAAQVSVAEQLAVADVVIDNGADPAALEAAVDRAVAALRREART